MAAETEKEKPKSNDKDSQKPASSSAEPASQPSVEEKENESAKNESNSAESDSSSDHPAVSTSPAKPTDKTVKETVAKPNPKSTPESSNASESAVSDSQVEQKLAEMMDIDTSDLGDKDTDSVKDTERQSTASNASIGDLNDLNDEADEMDVSDVSSSIAENENDSKTPSPKKKPKKRQPPIMIGYKKRRKVHNKKIEDEIKIESEVGSPVNESVDEKSADESKKIDQSGSSDDNASETSSTSSTSRSVALIDKYCWICHKEGPTSYKCIACPRVYHPKCLTQTVEDPSNFHCPECSAILKADNVNTRSPVMQAVNLDQLCTLLKHVIDIIKIQRDAHYFFGPVDTKEFPHYREYVVNPMDILMLEKNVKNKMYGCTEAFLADMKWIVHNSIVFNTKTAKITNVAKNLLKTCKREVSEIETCAECYYNLLVRKDTWFIEVCKRPHLLIWARLKGYPPWPAKAIKCKDEMVDCRFFGAHDKAWVPLKDVYLYSKVSPQIVKVKPGSNLDEGIQEIEKHIKKLKEKFGSFQYAEYREPYNPSAELEQLKSMLPNFNPDSSASASKSAPPVSAIKPKTLFNESTASPTSVASSRKSSSPDTDVSTASAKLEPSTEDPASSETTVSIDTESSTAEAAKLVCDESSLPASGDSGASNVEVPKNTGEDEPASSVAEPSELEEKISTISSAANDKARDTTDTEAEESDSSRSTTKSTSTVETFQKIEGMDRKLVSVKKIELINAAATATAAAAPERKITRPVPIAPKPVPALVATNPLASLTTIVNSTMASTNVQFNRKINDNKVETVRSVKAVEEISGKPKSKITVKNFASFEKCDTSTNGKSSPSTQTPPLAAIVRKEPAKVVKPSNEPDYNLDKVKDEPIEVDMSPQCEDPIFVREIPAPTRVPVNKPILSKSAPEVTHRKRSMVEDIDSSSNDTGKKSKNDPNCRTVNITENVTLSLINNQHQLTNVVENVPAAVPAKTQAILKPKPPAKNFAVASNVSPADTPTLTNTHTHANAITKPVRIAPAPGPTPIRMFTTAQQQRIVNGNAAMNGTVSPRSNILVVQSPKQSVKNPPTFGANCTGDIMVQFMSELLSNNRKAMEDTLDKIAGKGDLRAKVILLQKEIENVKKNHEMMVDEIKRDYEVQIAELRAASIAQKKYDLAHERLKLEKEKELAVKEAKSKQWCSNCQKSANYYCCWNTAYCDFECQKEHWNQHMHVCKNDVKRKAAECSENEPPRIMMQNDGLNDYKSMMNGYDKMATPTYTYQSSNHVSSSSRSNGGTKMQMKSSAAKNPRPLLPRVTATVTCSPSVYSSTPAVTATLVDNSYPNVSTTVTPLRSTMIGSVNVHPLIRQAQQQLHNK